MRKRGLTTAVLVLLCAVLLVLPFMSMLLTVAHAGHDCVATQCSVWPAVLQARTFLRQLSLALVCIGIALVAWLKACAYVRRGTHRRKTDTPIALKVRLNP